MDAKETLTRLPLTGCLLAILLGIAFILCRTQDQALQAAVYAYHAQHLLKIETPIYEDFYSKRLAIDQVGSPDKLIHFKQARKESLKPLLSQLIISDRNFRPYLQDKSHLFFSAKELENWHKHSQQLEKLLQSLPTYKYALIPEQFKTTPQFSRLISYLFVETEPLNLLSNVVILFGLFILLEAYVIRRTLWLSLFCLSLAHSCLYLLVASPLSAPLSGANVLLYFLLGLAMCRFLQGYFRTNASLKLYLLGLISIACLVKTGLDIYFQFIFPAQSAGIVLAVMTGAMLGWRGTIWRPVHRSQEALPPQVETTKDLPADMRARYQEALTALTRFNFAYARSTLADLHSQAPASGQLLESRYHLEKLHPDDGHFWLLLKARIEQAMKQDNYSLLLDLFKDIQYFAGANLATSQVIDPSDYLKILHIFLDHHNLQKAEQVFTLLQACGDKNLTKDACQLLIEHFSKKRLLSKQAHYQALYDHL